VTYRKGERPVAVPLDRFGAGHPVAHMIATGDRWFEAWLSQKATPVGTLAKTTGIPVGRLHTIAEGGPISRAELDALARAWSVSTGDLVASMPGEALVVP